MSSDQIANSQQNSASPNSPSKANQIRRGWRRLADSFHQNRSDMLLQMIAFLIVFLLGDFLGFLKLCPC